MTDQQNQQASFKNSALVCVSHSPIIMIRARPPQEEEMLLAYYARCAQQIKTFSPERVIIFGSDHFSGFHLSLMPAYCIGVECTAVADVGGFPGQLNVPGQEAMELAQSLRVADFDMAVSYRMKVDHGFSQPLKRLLGELDCYPVIPVFIGSLTPPFLSFKRTRLLGEAIGQLQRKSGKRTLFIGSGGLSHHPTRYYPLVGEGSSDVAAWQLEGDRSGVFTEEQWLEHIYDSHVEGAQMLVSGRRTRQDIRLNPEKDQRFLEIIGSDDLTALDSWDQQQVLDEAGVGFLELHTWVCARAAHLAAGGTVQQESQYAPTLEYGIGYGMASAGLASGS